MCMYMQQNGTLQQQLKGIYTTYLCTMYMYVCMYNYMYVHVCTYMYVCFNTKITED